MLHEKEYKEKVSYIESEVKMNKRKIDSWKAVGKNYALNKNGQPYTDPRKAFNGVNGISEVKKYKTGYRYRYFLCNSDGFSIEITGLSIQEIEEKIREEIKNAEEAVKYDENLLKNFNKNVNKCDEIAEIFFNMFDNKKPDQDTSAYYMTKSYLESIIEEWEKK